MSVPVGFEDKVGFAWRVADRLRGHFKPHEYGSVMLPLLVLRRLDAVLEPTKPAVLAKARDLTGASIGNPNRILQRGSRPCSHRLTVWSAPSVRCRPRVKRSRAACTE